LRRRKHTTLEERKHTTLEEVLEVVFIAVNIQYILEGVMRRKS
jgi:hypothetical protein